MKKKILSLALVLVMMFTMLPMTALAAPPEGVVPFGTPTITMNPNPVTLTQGGTYVITVTTENIPDGAVIVPRTEWLINHGLSLLGYTYTDHPSLPHPYVFPIANNQAAFTIFVAADATIQTTYFGVQAFVPTIHSWGTWWGNVAFTELQFSVCADDPCIGCGECLCPSCDGHASFRWEKFNALGYSNLNTRVIINGNEYLTLPNLTLYRSGNIRAWARIYTHGPIPVNNPQPGQYGYDYRGPALSSNANPFLVNIVSAEMFDENGDLIDRCPIALGWVVRNHNNITVNFGRPIGNTAPVGYRYEEGIPGFPWTTMEIYVLTACGEVQFLRLTNHFNPCDCEFYYCCEYCEWIVCDFCVYCGECQNCSECLVFNWNIFNNGPLGDPSTPNQNLADAGVIRLWTQIDGVSTLIPTYPPNVTAVIQGTDICAMYFVRIGRVWVDSTGWLNYINLIDVRKTNAWEFIELTIIPFGCHDPVTVLLHNGTFVPQITINDYPVYEVTLTNLDRSVALPNSIGGTATGPVTLSLAPGQTADIITTLLGGAMIGIGDIVGVDGAGSQVTVTATPVANPTSLMVNLSTVDVVITEYATIEVLVNRDGVYATLIIHLVPCPPPPYITINDEARYYVTLTNHDRSVLLSNSIGGTATGPVTLTLAPNQDPITIVTSMANGTIIGIGNIVGVDGTGSQVSVFATPAANPTNLLVNLSTVDVLIEEEAVIEVLVNRGDGVYATLVITLLPCPYITINGEERYYVTLTNLDRSVALPNSIGGTAEGRITLSLCPDQIPLPAIITSMLQDSIIGIGNIVGVNGAGSQVTVSATPAADPTSLMVNLSTVDVVITEKTVIEVLVNRGCCTYAVLVITLLPCEPYITINDEARYYVTLTNHNRSVALANSIGGTATGSVTLTLAPNQDPTEILTTMLGGAMVGIGNIVGVDGAGNQVTVTATPVANATSLMVNLSTVDVVIEEEAVIEVLVNRGGVYATLVITLLPCPYITINDLPVYEVTLSNNVRSVALPNSIGGTAEGRITLSLCPDQLPLPAIITSMLQDSIIGIGNIVGVNGAGSQVTVSATPAADPTSLMVNLSTATIQIVDEATIIVLVNRDCCAVAKLIIHLVPYLWTVTFDSTGGTAVASQVVPDGGLATLPTPAPTRANHIFAGWFTAPTGGTQFNFATPITADITLFARWTPDPGPGIGWPPGNGGGVVTPPVEQYPDDEVPLAPLSPYHHAYLIGYTDGTIRPNNNITRAEVTTIFFRLICDDYRGEIWRQTNQFPDVVLQDWFNNAISTLAGANFLRGYPDGYFRPNQAMTRAEFAALLVRIVNGGNNGAAGNTSFTDVAGHWAENYIYAAYALGWANGFGDGTFRPDRQITRAEVAALVNRALNRLPEYPSDLLEGMVTWPDNMNQNAWYYLYIQEATNSHEHEMKECGTRETWVELLTPREWWRLERPDSNPNIFTGIYIGEALGVGD